jgi:purine-binding chemotaxis protein CheW
MSATQLPVDPCWEDLARIADPSEEPGPEARRLELVTFALDGDAYAVPVERVREIVRLRPITPVPRVPAAVCGVISLRGEVAQVIDLRRCLGMPPLTPSRASRIIVLQRDEGAVAGLLVDAVHDVLRIDATETRPSPTGEGEGVVALYSRRGEFVSLLDLDRVLELGIER